MKKNRLDDLREQIVAHFKEIGISTCRVTFADTAVGANSTCRVHLERYADLGRGLSFAQMQWLSNLLHTEKINIEDQYHTDGCDTCDWGASDAADLVAYEIDPFNEKSAETNA